MEYSIEVCIKENQTTTDKGKILENLTRDILKQQQLLNVKHRMILCLGKLSLNCLGMLGLEMQVRDG